MYKVIKMYGDCEPWWFLEGWESDIVSSKEFKHYTAALNYYQKEYAYLAKTYPYQKSKSDKMVAFWTPKEQSWCEDCDEYLQQYHSILLLEEGVWLEGLRKRGLSNRIRSCQLK